MGKKGGKASKQGECSAGSALLSAKFLATSIVLPVLAFCVWQWQKRPADFAADVEKKQPFERMVDFVRQSGGIVEVNLTYANGVRGIAATRNMGEKEVVLFLPEGLYFADTMTPRGIRKIISGTGGNAGGSVFEKVQLAFGLLYERALWLSGGTKTTKTGWASLCDGCEPLIHAWFEALPTEYGAIVNFTQAEVKLIEKIANLGSKQRTFNAFTTMAHAVALKIPTLPTDDGWLRWVWGTVLSREFQLPETEGVGNQALMPVMDMINHHWDTARHNVIRASCSYQHSGKRGCVIMTTRAVRAGEELQFSYGNFSNLQLIVNYGFTLNGNPWRFHEWIRKPTQPLPEWVTSRCPLDTWRPRWKEGKGFPGGHDFRQLAFCERLRALAEDDQKGVDAEGAGATTMAGVNDVPAALGGKHPGGIGSSNVMLQKADVAAYSVIADGCAEASKNLPSSTEMKQSGAMQTLYDSLVEEHKAFQRCREVYRLAANQLQKGEELGLNQ